MPSAQYTELQCGDNESLFRVEVTTGPFFDETSWDLVDVSSNTVVMAYDNFDRGNSIFVEEKCLESNLCYQFTIYDSYGDGLSSPGSYSVKYDNQLIKEGGGDFGNKEESGLFGDGWDCVSLPSSSPPTQSQKPTSFPTGMPSAYPTISQKPTALPSRIPSFTPSSPFQPTSILSSSFQPTSSPTELQDSISYNYDDFNRRFFPSSPLLHEDALKGIVASYHTWPNCSASGDGDRVGCVLIPKRINHRPSWAGTLYSGKPPICRRGRCDLQIPMSNDALQIDVAGADVVHYLQSKANIELLSDVRGSTSVVVVADVNNDGRPDLIIGNEDDGYSNQLLMNQGNGVFKEVDGVLPNENWSTSAIGVGDMNNDGFPDLIIGNDEEIKLLLNQGNGTFENAPGAIIAGGSLSTSRIAIADVNSDGFLDVILKVGGDLHVLSNQGDSTFVEVTADAISADTSFTTSIAVADVNGDDHTDIILGNYYKPTKVLLNQGDGTFVELEGSIPITPVSSDRTNAIAVADLDGDGDIDLVIANVNREDPIQILLNQGNGTFEEEDVVIPFGVKFIPMALAVADMDGDGQLDILIGTGLDNPNYLVQNQGSGSFRIVEGAFDEAEDDKSTFSIAVSDVNGDGRVDVIIGTSNNEYYDTAHIQVLLNKEVIKYLEAWDAIPGGDLFRTVAIAVADLDGDGLPDLVVGKDEQPNQVLLNQGDGTFQEVLSDVSSGDTKTAAVAVGDLNGDGLLDIVIGNKNEKNQLMLNQGDGTFRESDLVSPGDDHTTALALADVNGDGHFDILVGNDSSSPNQVFINKGDGTFVEVDGAIPGDFDTFAIAVADFNNDGFIDIVIGNNGGYYGNVNAANQLLLNKGNGTFEEIVQDAIPGEYNTRSLAVADVNGDGLIDIIVGNEGYYGHPNQVLLNRGDATFEEKVNALPIDAYDTYDIAVGDVDGDGHPDLLIGNNFGDPNQLLLNQGDGTFKEAADMIPSDRLWTNSIAFADVNNDGRLDIVIGNEGDGERTQILFFSDCSNGGAPLHGSSWCFPCPSFMGRSINWFSVCRECPPDHIQDESNGQCSPEPCSFFQERKLGEDTCTLCPDGSFYNSSVLRLDSQPSSFLQYRCAPCEGGTFHSNAIHAVAVDQCSSCPPRISSLPGSSTCSYCNEDYILNSTFKGGLLEISPTSNQSSSFTFYSHLCGAESTFDVNVSSVNLNDSLNKSFFTYFNCEEFIFESQSNEMSCLSCPTDAECNFNTTLETLGVPPTYWRDSLNTSALYFCEGTNPERCSATSASVTSPDDYCAPEFKGPLCKLCKEDNKYFNDSDGECLDCGSIFFLKAIAVVVALAFGFWVTRFMGRKYQSLRARGFETKIKILISFYQVAATFGSVYGIRLHEDVAWILNFLSNYLSFGILDLLSVPADCVGSKQDQLLLIILSPLGFLMLACACLFWASFREKGNNWKDRFLNVALMTFYLVLPGISNSIFSIIQCQRFITIGTRDDPLEYSRYLIDDLSVECDRSDPRYASLQVLFAVSLVLWPVLVNILWIHLISRIWHPIRAHRLTPLANACRFLWRDYEPSMMFWDVVDLIRKIFLTGVIACIDMQASTEVIRLSIAVVISLVYVVILAMCQPYKRADDHYLAVISNILLSCCFLMGIILNICDDEYDSCKRMMGFESLKTASVVVVVMMLGTLVISVCLVVAMTFLTITHPVLTVVKPGEKPNLVLNAESNCEFHAFFSHVWSTGKAKSHAIVRKMQLVMPSVRIWLDVDNIEGYGGDLEQAVAESVVFFVFVSKGYFASKNCQREIITAIILGKPVIVIYEGDVLALESMMNECKRYCTGTTDEETLSKMLHHLEHSSIPWVDENVFAAKALNVVSTMFLANLPYYQSHPAELEGGVYVPGELGEIQLTSAVNLIICESNEGTSDVAHELMTMAGNDSRLITIRHSIAVVSELDSLLRSSRQEEGEIDATTGNEDKREVMILYLNQETFKHDADELTDILKRVIDHGIEIILLHELDPERKGCEFGNFFHQTPMELLEEPYKIYSRSIALPLYGYDDYRELGLKRLLCKMGAEEVSEGMLTRISKSIRGTLINRF
jgi:hypothetical protein